VPGGWEEEGKKSEDEGKTRAKGATLLIIQVGDTLRKEIDGKVWRPHVIEMER
jgi:hypothetical protein